MLRSRFLCSFKACCRSDCCGGGSDLFACFFFCLLPRFREIYRDFTWSAVRVPPWIPGPLLMRLAIADHLLPISLWMAMSCASCSGVKGDRSMAGSKRKIHLQRKVVTARGYRPGCSPYLSQHAFPVREGKCVSANTCQLIFATVPQVCRDFWTCVRRIVSSAASQAPFLMFGRRVLFHR